MKTANASMRHSHPYATQFRLLAGVCFLCMLPVALIARASNWRWRPWPPGREGYRSVYQEALTNAKTAAAIALSV